MFRPSRLLIVIPFFLAACGSTTQDRVLSGGGIGAAGGAVIGAVTGLSVLQGALIGTGLGAVIGGLTSPDKLNLGNPIWNRSDGPAGQGATASGGYSQSVADIQRDLKRLGYDPGPVDGVLGPKTRAAIAHFEKDKGRSPTQKAQQPASTTEQMAASP